MIEPGHILKINGEWYVVLFEPSETSSWTCLCLDDGQQIDVPNALLKLFLEVAREGKPYNPGSP